MKFSPPLLLLSPLLATADELFQPLQTHESDQCTAILVSAGAAAKGVGSMTTHTNDCKECDFRLAKVPAMDHPANSTRKIWGGRAAYPRYIGDDRGDVYTAADVLTGDNYFAWDESVSKALGEIPEVAHTYGYLDGDYAIQNEHQLSMGESTCGALLASAPLWDFDNDGKAGKALLEQSELTRIALERCETARCACQTMGDLAVEYGFYGAVWKGDETTVYGEAGEAITINDKTESFMWHVLPDDTGASAVWVCQKVPEGHVAAVANGFVIKEIDLTDTENFLGSDNVYDVAERAGLWEKGQHFSFAEVYGQRRGHMATYVNRRVWRVFDTVAPSLKLSPHTDQFASSYPFSVKSEIDLTIADIAKLQRDHYQGTEFDTGSGIGGGPFGNIARYDGSLQEGATHEDLLEGRFERTITLFRTSYSFVTQTRNTVDDVLGLTWFAPYSPHSSVYMPVYSHVMNVPSSLSVGSLFKLDKRANFWAFLSVGQWCAQWFSYTQPTIEANQAKFENKWFEEQATNEALALEIGGFGGDMAVRGYLTDFSEAQAAAVLKNWWELFDTVIATWRDGYHVLDFKVETYAPVSLFYPKWWLEKVGFWGEQCKGGSTIEEARERNKGEKEVEIKWDEKEEEVVEEEEEKEEEEEEKEEEKEEEEKEEDEKEEEEKEETKKSPEVEVASLGAASPVPVEGHSSHVVAGAMLAGGLVGAAFTVFYKKREQGYQTIPV